MVSLELATSPDTDPFRIAAGRRALDLAWRATEAALNRPLVDHVVRVE
jgi:hypothetical protein